MESWLGDVRVEYRENFDEQYRDFACSLIIESNQDRITLDKDQIQQLKEFLEKVNVWISHGDITDDADTTYLYVRKW